MDNGLCPNCGGCVNERHRDIDGGCITGLTSCSCVVAVDKSSCGCGGCEEEKEEVVRTFSTGANRDQDVDKFDYEGFLSPLVIERYGAYMHKNRHLKDGSMRDSDNWQRGIPRDVYMKSAYRHFLDWWLLHRGYPAREEDITEALCGMLFNTMGFLHEELKARVEYGYKKAGDE